MTVTVITMQPVHDLGVERSSDSDDSSRPFLFINKGMHNLSRTSAEVFAVGSHVSRGSRKWTKNKSSLNLDSSTGKILASSGIRRPSLPRSASPVTGKPVTMRWRIDGASSSKAEGISRRGRKLQRTNSSEAAAPVKESESETLSIAAVRHVSDDSSHDSLVAFYLQTIQPFVLTISPQLVWINDENLISGSRALKMAICAFASAFRSALHIGVRALVLPPLSENGSPILWPTPDWFRLQAKAISCLRQKFTEADSSSSPFREAELHAVLFLMRLQVLLCERDWAFLHSEAIVKMTENSTKVFDLSLETSLWHINIVTAYVHRSNIHGHKNTNSLRHFITDGVCLDAENMTSADQQQLSRISRDRQLLWRLEPPDQVGPLDGLLADDDLSVDTRGGNTHWLDPQVVSQLRSCAQMSRYLIVHLTMLSYDTALPKIRNAAEGLHTRLLALVTKHNLEESRPLLLFWMMFAGALASRGFEIRSWFVAQLATMANNCRLCKDFDEMKEVLSLFLDSGSLHDVLLHEILEEMRGSNVATA